MRISSRRFHAAQMTWISADPYIFGDAFPYPLRNFSWSKKHRKRSSRFLAKPLKNEKTLSPKSCEIASFFLNH